MDSDKFRGTKTRKAKPVLKHTLLQKITSGFFRLLEKIVVLVFVLKLIFKASMALESSCEQYKGFLTVFAGRHFVFAIGNVIIVAILVKSGRFSSRGSNFKASTDCIYEEFLAKAETGHGIVRHEQENRSKLSLRENREEQSTAAMKQKQDTCENRPKHDLSEKKGLVDSKAKPDLRETRAKHVLGESKVEPGRTEIGVKQSATETSTKQSKTENKQEQSNPASNIYRRTHSEKLLTSCDDSYRKLRRSETDKFAKTAKSDEGIRKQWYPEDDMSEVEFLSKIEAFIARQRRFQLDEGCCSC